MDTGWRGSTWTGASDTESSGWIPGTSGELTVTVDWTNSGDCTDQMTLTIDDPLGVVDWNLGMANTVTGYLDEDCFSRGCHPVRYEDKLTGVCEPTAVVLGQTTLHRGSDDPNLTYYLADTLDCFVFGRDLGYYDSLGCIPLF